MFYSFHHKFYSCLIILLLSSATATAQTYKKYDIVVYGDSSAAVMATIAAQNDGRKVVLVNPTQFLGGMSASGLGATDFGNSKLDSLGSYAGEFYRRVAKHYGREFIRSFEPHVGQKVFNEMAQEAGVEVHLNEKIDRENGVKMKHGRIVSITTLSGKTFKAKMFIDATYVGDLMAAAGVSYTVGRESEAQYGESIAGVRRGDTFPRVHYTQSNKDHFVADVDPYISPGDPKSGLLPMVHELNLVNGIGDKKIQAYNYRMCLTSNPDERVPLTKPDKYRALDHELLIRNFEAGDHRFPALIEPLGGRKDKVDWNSMHAIGNDFGGANWEYPEASYVRRREIEQEHRDYTRGFFYTLSTNPRIPDKIQDYAKKWGLPKDEFKDNGNWPYMIYIREARRMLGEYVMTQADCSHKRGVDDIIAYGAFGMDSHVVQYFVNEKGFVRRDGVIWRTPPGLYGISYRSVIPKREECSNLYVPVCLSASHVAHGSIRMEPVFMTMGQSVAMAAGLAIDGKVDVQDVDYDKLRKFIPSPKNFKPVKKNTLKMVPNTQN